MVERVGVTLGRMVEITPAEGHALARLSNDMDRLALHHAKGWFFQYVRAHKEAHVIIRTIITRSHAT